MTWFKIDDGFHSHRKVKMIPRTKRREVIGTWTMAGSWSGDELTEGHIPSFMLEEFGSTPDDAVELVRVGLWEAVEDGWRFHDWLDYNPSKAEVLAERAKTKDRVARHRAKVRAERNGGGNAVTNIEAPAGNGVTHAPGHPWNRPAAAATDAVGEPVTDAVGNAAGHSAVTPVTAPVANDVSNAVTHPVSTGAPTRPVPVNNKTPRSEPVAAQAEPVASAPGENKTPTDAETVARALFRAIAENGNRPAAITESQLKQAGFLLREHPVAEVLETITWCQQDVTWHSNVLGVNDLRRHYDKLRAKINSEAGGGPKPKPTGRAGAMAKGRAMDARLAGEFDHGRPARSSVVGVLG